MLKQAWHSLRLIAAVANYSLFTIHSYLKMLHRLVHIVLVDTPFAWVFGRSLFRRGRRVVGYGLVIYTRGCHEAAGEDSDQHPLMLVVCSYITGIIKTGAKLR